MNTAEFQSQIIDKLDKVVAGAEALMMDGQARTLADFTRLKSEIQGLLDVVTAFEKACCGESGLQSVKQTIAALKRTVEAERRPEGAAPVSGTDADIASPSERPLTADAMASEEDGLPFGFEVLDAGATDPVPEVAVEAAVSVESGAAVSEPAAVSTEETEVEAVEKEPEKTKEPELGLMFDEEPEETSMETTTETVAVEEEAASEEAVSGTVPEAEIRVEAIPAEPVASAESESVEPVSESVSMSETEANPMPVAEVGSMPVAEAASASMQETEAASMPETLPEPTSAPIVAGSNANEIFETIKQESLARFSVREEDQPQSYITQLTAMAQAQVKPGEQDMSGVAVSSTARPDTEPEPVSSGDSLMESLRSTRANLYGGQLRTMVDKFKAPQTLYDIQHNRPVDLKMTIGVNEKYLLAQELFGGNIKEYTEAVGRLNDAKDTAAATEIWRSMSRQRAWDESSLAYATFYDLLKRRFPDLA